MELDSPFVRLPLRFDAAALAAEVAALPHDAWRAHPQGEPGNTAVPLVTVGGDPDDDGTAGAMAPTPALASLPYVRQVLASLGTVVGRTRLMRVQAEASLGQHADVNHYWREHLRVHVPIVTDPSVRFTVDGHSVHMAAGETWVFDTWRSHGVENPSGVDRIHLVVDTVGSVPFWELVDDGERPIEGRPPSTPERFVGPAANVSTAFDTERFNRSGIMTPWELAGHVDALVRDLRAGPEGGSEEADRAIAALVALRRAWRHLWAVHGSDAEAVAAYRARRERARELVEPLAGRLHLENGTDFVIAARAVLLDPALSVGHGARARQDRPAVPARQRFAEPVFVVSSPRSGSSLLFETLALSPTAWTIGGESHAVIESVPALAPAARGWSSNRLVATDATPEVVEAVAAGFLRQLRDRGGNRPPAEGTFRLLEKTPKNSLRVPFLAAAFPDARFVYLYRDPRETISSMLDAWRSGRFVTYRDLPGWGPNQPWSLLLTPGWEELRGRPLAEVVANQWATTTATLLDDLEALDPDRWCVASYDALAREPAAEVERLCGFLGFAWDHPLDGPLPLSRHTLDAPEPDKWRRNAEELRDVWDVVEPVAVRAHSVFAAPPRIEPRRRPAVTDTVKADPDDAPPRRAAGNPFGSVHTASMPELLGALDATPLVSTYQSGRLIALRLHDGVLNTHFRQFLSPMGMAVGRRGLAIGTKRSIWLYANNRAVAAKVEPAGTHDACFLPRMAHITGDIAVHELAWVDDELWIVNTRFSCLATLDRDSSFRPVWRPPFVSALSADDRCHLNGMAIAGGAVRYVTCLGATDTGGGWRERKVDGGVVVDVASGEIVATGLSMPHSPRLHDGRLWVLESGRGAVCTVDVDTGEVTTVAELPGFTRGLAFAGRYAFVGLSQVRDSVFGGIPLAERLDARVCGVWVLDTVTGATVGFVRFEGDVREVFDVQLVPGVRFPEIVEPGTDLTASTFTLPSDAMADVADPG